MIYTVTLNPALDYTIQAEHLSLGKINEHKENTFLQEAKESMLHAF